MVQTIKKGLIVHEAFEYVVARMGLEPITSGL